MSRFNEIVKNALGEAKQRGDLYHGTTFESLLNILKLNKIYANRPIGISVSRSPSIGNDFGDGTVIVLDGDKLSEKYKIFPMSFQGEDVGEEVIQTNKDLPLHYKTPEHNNAFINIVYRLDNGMADENEFANMYNGSELPNALDYIKEIRVPEKYFTQEYINEMGELCAENDYDLPPVKPSKKYNSGIEKNITIQNKKDINRPAFHNNTLRNLNPKDKADLEANFDYAGYDLPDEIN